MQRATNYFGMQWDPIAYQNNLLYVAYFSSLWA